MGRYRKTMGNRNHRSRGFTLIAALLIMVLLSGLAVGLMYLASNEVSMGGNDQEENLANYGAESGMEELTANLYTLYQSGTNPSGVAVQALAAQSPSAALIPNMTYAQTITYATDANGNPKASGYNPISSGPNQGLIAQIIPMTLQVTATRNAIASGPSNSDGSTGQISGASVNITRRIEVSLIPVFQFGVFCDGDCDWFAGPNFSFGGRVHANGNLFLASGATLEFSDKIQAAGEIILDQLENNWPTNNGYQGAILVPNASGGCPLPATFNAGPNCLTVNEGYNQVGDASWTGGFAPRFGAAVNRNTFATNAARFGGFYENGTTGGSVLSLPFVASNNNVPVDQEQIVRKPIAGEVTGTTNLSNSRLYNKAAIRILLADNIADLHPERGAGALVGDIQLNSNLFEAIATGIGNEYFAMAQGPGATWGNPPTGETSPWSLLGKANNTSPNNGAWLRVEYMTNAATIPPTYAPVTAEWLSFGFGRGNFDVNNKAIPPFAPWGTAGANNISPAILIFQELQTAGLAATGIPAANTQYNWYPINFYDAREGEPRDYTGFVRAGVAGSCNPIGVMNAVELDVGNLWLWLQRLGPYAAGSGNLVNSQAQNGYVLYFSDHRGMQPDPNTTGGGAPPVSPAGVMSGVSGLEDTINSANAAGTPDGVLEPIVFYNGPAPKPVYSPEDVDKNGKLDNWGEVNLANGFPGASNAAANVYADTIANCSTTGRINIATGARHVLRLVDAGMGAGNISYLPGSAAAPNTTGFTVASEEPVYVYGNYNTGPNDPLWANPSNPNAQHAAAAIIADTVTLLTSQWRDIDSLNFPAKMNCNAGAAERCGGTIDGVNFANAYYRMAVASGKSIPFPNPGWAGANAKDFGTDGGMHNFLRYLENMGNISINYSGSMVSLYYSQYATGNFKCCGVVYSPPNPRNYNFDTLFLNPANLPPGTPAFQDIVNLSYHQNFTPQ